MYYLDLITWYLSSFLVSIIEQIGIASLVTGAALVGFVAGVIVDRILSIILKPKEEENSTKDWDRMIKEDID